MLKIDKAVSIEWIIDKMPALAPLYPLSGYADLNWNPFYSTVWVELYKNWLFIPVLLIICAFFLCRTRTGLIILFIVALSFAIIFGFIYKNPNYSEEYWRIASWLLSYTLIGGAGAFFLGLLRRMLGKRAASDKS